VTTPPRRVAAQPDPLGGSGGRSANAEGLGFLLGYAITVVTVAELMIWVSADAVHDFQPYGLEASLKWLTFATPGAGYLVAGALVSHRALRRLGVGMLLGLTLALPLPAALTFTQFALWHAATGG
jgi:hypothetical protein